MVSFLISYDSVYWSLKKVLVWIPNPYQSVLKVDHHVEVPDKVAPQDELIRFVQVLHHEETHLEVPSYHKEDC